MLQVNLNFPDFHNEQIIKMNCSKFGHIKSVKIHRSPSSFAVVQMEENEQARELASSFGGSALGNYARVHLTHVSNNAVAA